MSTSNTKLSLERTNRQIHIYLGLYLILFLWLFSVSGLLMNHPKWFGHHIDRQPRQTTVELPETTNTVARAKLLRDQLGLTGEIILRAQRRPTHFAFMVMRPQLRYGVNVELATGATTVTTVTPASHQALGQLHTFSGVRGIWNEPEQERDWIATKLWSLSMDAVCIGTIILVLSSLYMAWQIKEKRRPIIVSLALGAASCAYFVWGLAAMG